MGRRPNPDLPEMILRATADIIEESGPDAVTMRGVARRIDYTATTIYIYFTNKDELLDKTVVRAFDWFAEAMAEAASTGTGRERIRNRARGYIRWALEHKGLYRLMFQHDSIRPLDAETGSVQPPTFRDSQRLIEDAVASGELPASLDPATMTRVNWAGLHGAISLALSGRMFGDPAKVGMDSIEAQTMALAEQFVDSWMGRRD